MGFFKAIRPNEELGLNHLEVLKNNGFDYSRDKNWSMFEKAYEKAYGELPVTGFLKMQKKYERGDVQ